MEDFRTSITADHLSVFTTYLAFIFIFGFFFFVLFRIYLLLLKLLLRLIRILYLNINLQSGIDASFFLVNLDDLVELFSLILKPFEMVYLFYLDDHLLNVILNVFKILFIDVPFLICVFLFAFKLFLPSFVVQVKIPFSF